MNSGGGILIMGILWLIFWLGPAFFLFEEDSRWGHNFAIPLLFINVGLARFVNKISCQLTAAVASFLTIPILLAFWRWDISTMISGAFLGIFCVLYLVERTRETELINPNKRLRAWLKIHMLTFAYIGLAHMPLIFFLVRWYNPEPFETYLPVEHHISTSMFNLMLLVLSIIAIMERFVRKIGSVKIEHVGFYWSILMILIPIILINIGLE
jgi:hypothetical protein